jgi:hypothetical protein
MLAKYAEKHQGPRHLTALASQLLPTPAAEAITPRLHGSGH